MHLAASAGALRKTDSVLISIQNYVALHSELARSVISILQRDDLQTPGDNTTIAAQSRVIHQLSLSDEAQIIPERTFPTYEKLNFQ